MAQNPQVLQDEWLLAAIPHSIDPFASYINPIIHKGFVRNGRVCTSGGTKSALLRIHQFLKVTRTGSITAILTDNRHKVLANFKYDPAIQKFEGKYKQRITFNTLNSLIMVNHCDLKFIKKFELITNYDKSFNSKFEVAVLDVSDCDIYQRDQVQFNYKFETSLRFVYECDEYKRVTGDPELSDKNENRANKLISNDYDDMVSL